MSRMEEKIEIKCRYCGGSGKRYESEFLNGHHMPHTVKCRICNGNGKYLAVRN